MYIRPFLFVLCCEIIKPLEVLLLPGDGVVVVVTNFPLGVNKVLHSTSFCTSCFQTICLDLLLYILLLHYL